MKFVIWPAIDLRGGRCVRLRQGRAEEQTVYGTDPAAMARRWVAEGARGLHVVDLDGAFAGRPVQLDVVGRMAAAAHPVPLELGGGLRTDADIEAARAAGVARVVIGTRACGEPSRLRRLVEQHGEALAVGIDARAGRVAVRGWVETSAWSAVDLAGRMAEIGVHTLIVTDIGRDGMLMGAASELVAKICDAAPACAVVASGGISGPDDIRGLLALRRPNLVGAIVGKALYEGATTLAELQAAAKVAG
jgi:phosphoribosylformimino-5-aminoimidazole carboxamide ribotide isomerase